jgi:hypothetical protein
MNNAIAENFHVTSDPANNKYVDLCVIGGTTPENPVQPFVHPVGLKGKTGDIEVDSQFDEGAMVNSICKDTFTQVQETLGQPDPSKKSLRMADGTIVPSQGCWSGDVTLGGQTVNGSFEIFPSGGGWSLLFANPFYERSKLSTIMTMTPSKSLAMAIG